MTAIFATLAVVFLISNLVLWILYVDQGTKLDKLRTTLYKLDARKWMEDTKVVFCTCSNCKHEKDYQLGEDWESNCANCLITNPEKGLLVRKNWEHK